MAATVLATRRARPALSAMSSQSFETSTPMHKGPATVERSVEADWRRATMAHLSQEGEGPLAQDCNSGWARPTVRAQDRKGRTTDRDCLRTRVPSRIDLAVLPAILTADAKPSKNSRSTRTIQGNLGRPASPGSPRRFAPRDDGSIEAERANGAHHFSLNGRASTSKLQAERSCLTRSAAIAATPAGSM
jgi:hypothetical protein